MGRKKAVKAPVSRPVDIWIEDLEITVNGRQVIPGTELKISKERGRFRFIKKVTTETAEWVDVWGGPPGSECWRSFYLSRIKTVHSKNKTGKNLLKARKAS